MGVGKRSVSQRAPTFLSPGTSSVEDNFSTTKVGGIVSE